MSNFLPNVRFCSQSRRRSGSFRPFCREEKACVCLAKALFCAPNPLFTARSPEEFVAHLTGNRDCAPGRIAAMPGITRHKPQATLVIFQDISALPMSAEEFVCFVREKHRLATFPIGKNSLPRAARATSASVSPPAARCWPRDWTGWRPR